MILSEYVFYPDFKNALLILFVSVLLSGLASAGLLVLFSESKGVGSKVFVVSLVSLISFATVYAFVESRYKKVFYGMFSLKINFNFLYTIIPMIIGTIMLNMFFSSVITVSKDNSYNDFMMLVASNKSVIVFFMIPIVIIAPITEELVFRGMILKGFAGNYKPGMAIFLSAFLFSVIHLNLAQIPNAFILGVIFAFLMIHTRNILYTIIYHAINNFWVTFMLFFVKPEDLAGAGNTSGDTASPAALLVIAILGILLIYIGLKWTVKTITGEDRKIIPDEKVYNTYLSGLVDYNE